MTMDKKPVILLFVIFLTIYYSASAAADMVLKKDKNSSEVILAEEGPVVQSVAGEEKKDHLSKDELSSDVRFRQYIEAVNEAVGYIEDGLYGEAVKKLKKSIILEPSLPYAYDNLANAYYHLHKYEEAMSMSKTSLKMDPNYASAYGNLGNIYYALGKYVEAKENYLKAKELFLKKGDAAGVARIEESLMQPFSKKS